MRRRAGTCGKRRPTLLYAAAVCVLFPAAAAAQFGPPPKPTISGSITIDEPDNAARTHLDLVGAYIKNKQWAEALDTLQQLMENYGDKLVPPPDTKKDSDPQRYINVRDFCHQKICSLPAEALALYRRRVDPQARRWYDQGLANRDVESLEKIAHTLFASSWTDDALLVLGEIALQRGNFDRAREAWRLILPAGEPGAFAPSPEAGLAYPDTDLLLSEVYARLVLVSVLEGSTDRADTELNESLFGEKPGFAARFAEATGRLGGRRGKYAELLARFLSDARDWRNPPGSADWPTFAGAASRNHVAARAVSVAGKAWEIPLPEVSSASALINPRFNLHRVAERNHEFLSYHPVVIGDLVVVQRRRPNEDGDKMIDELLVYNLHTGKPAWGTDKPVYSYEMDRLANAPSLGVPRFTLGVHKHLLFARVGPPITNLTTVNFPLPQTTLLCLDLEAQGKLMWEIHQRRDFSFDGVPVTDGERVYVALRRRGPRPEAHVACYDIDNGREMWQRRVCQAEVRAQEGQAEITHNLLALHEDRIYFNTNIGAVAALSAEDGAILWLTTYPRTEELDLSQPKGYYYRDLTPCVYHRGQVFAAPADTPEILALDAKTGRVHWQREYPNVVHLLGVVHDKLMASGERLFWINAPADRPGGGGGLYRWRGDDSIHGYGRGVLAGQYVYWPGRHEVRIYHQQTALPVGLIRLRGEIPWGGNSRGGNLIVTPEHLLVAEPDRLVCFQQFSNRWREEHKRILQKNPDDAFGRYQLARCEEALERWQEATANYRRVLGLATPADRIGDRPLRLVAQRRLYELQLDHHAALVAQKQWSAAVEALKQAAEMAPDSVDLLRAKKRIAETLAAAGQPQQAALAWQEMITSPRLRNLAIEDEQQRPLQAARYAAQAIAALAEQDAGALAPINTAARAQLEQAQADNNPEAVWQVVEDFPNARSREEALRWLGEHSRGQQQWLAAAEAFAQAVHTEFSPRTAEVESNFRDRLDEVYGELGYTYARAKLLEASPAWKPEGRSRQQAVEQLTRDAQGQRTAAGLWKKTWQQTHDQLFLLPHGTPPGNSHLLLLTTDEKIKCLDLSSGQPRWSLEVPHPVQWAGYAGHTLLLGFRNAAWCVALDGRVRWQRRLADVPAKPRTPFQPSSEPAVAILRRHEDPFVDAGPNEPPLEQFVLGPDGRLFIRQGLSRILALDAATGAVLWTSSRQGPLKLQPHLAAVGGGLLIQETQPGAMHFLDAKTGESLNWVRSGAGGPWLKPPVRFDEQRALVVPDPNHVVMVNTEEINGERALLWSYNVPASGPDQDPDVLVRGDVLLVFYNGYGISRVNPEDGSEMWDDPIALPGRRPVKQPRQMITLDDQRVYCAASGVLRAYRLADGQPAWEKDQYLGPAESEWHLQRVGPVLAAYAGESQRETPIELVLFHPGDGRRIQRLRFPVNPFPTEVRLIGREALLARPYVWGLGPMPLKPEPASNQPSKN